MKKKYLNYIIVLLAFLFVGSAFASAEGGLFVNDADSEISDHLDGVYVIGSEGIDQLGSDKVYALTGSGLQLVGSAEAIGGGGLRYENGTVAIRSDRVKVGIAYSFSSARDSSVASAVLENPSGGGFALGYYDVDGVFQELAVSGVSALTVRPGPDTSVEVVPNGADEPICTLEETSKSNYLIVRTQPYSDESLIRYSGISYSGEFGFAVLADDRLTVVNLVDLEQYVMGVCAIEMTESWPIEALKAQAIAARTFVQRMIGSSVYYYNCGFDVTADTYTQAYRGTRGVGEKIRAAVAETRNCYLTQDGELIEALYSASDGGATEDGENIFGYPSSCLCGVLDPYEAAASQENPYSSWTVTMTPEQLGNKIGIGPIESVTASLSDTGNVIKLDFYSTSGQHRILIRDNCRTKLDLKSIRYEISRNDEGNFVFNGSGCGHQLGMSQWGAYSMAVYYQKDYRFILGFYYTDVGLSYGTLPDPSADEPDAA